MFCSATRWISVAAAALATACGSSSAEPAAACVALGRLARQAAACDPALDSLAERIEAEPDELHCRAAARKLISGPRKTPASNIQSVWARPDVPDTAPLTTHELDALAVYPQPSELILTPDVAPGPGIPDTSADVDRVELEPDARGRLHAHLPAHPGTLRLRHAGGETVYCLELRPCETLSITTHGDKLARHPAARPGPC